jgi:hypothetical protein
VYSVFLLKWRVRTATRPSHQGPETLGESNPKVAPEQDIRTGTPKRPGQSLAKPWSGHDETLVELRGIEPLTFSMRTRRATNCATAPHDARPV